MKDYMPEWFVENYAEFGLENTRFVALEDGERYKAVIPFLYTSAIVVGRTDVTSHYDNRWCYETFKQANEAFEKWDGLGEPEGWHRHPDTGRRRPGGSVEQEYINP